jgi:serine/threonine-protein kinase
VFYYVMELLDGVDLESLVTRYGPQPAARVIPLLIQACASLAEAHDAGLLHRDIKPPNLFISRAADEVDIVKLLDFGIVQTAGDAPARARPASPPAAADSRATLDGKLTQLGAMLGTPGFMAPEQILGMPLDGRADLYALGSCAWWLLTGGEVFVRDSAPALLHRHLYDPVPRLAEHVAGWCPPALEAVVTACLAKDARDRPRDARSLAARLRTIAIPDAVAWTGELAQAWWRGYQPTLAAVATGSDVQVIMPRSTHDRPDVATSENAIAQTLVSPPSATGYPD